MRLKKLKSIADKVYYLTIIIAAVVIGKNYYDQYKLPEGVCPVQNNAKLITFAIGLLIASFVFTLIVDRMVKKSEDRDD